LRQACKKGPFWTRTDRRINSGDAEIFGRRNAKHLNTRRGREHNNCLAIARLLPTPVARTRPQPIREPVVKQLVYTSGSSRRCNWVRRIADASTSPISVLILLRAATDTVQLGSDDAGRASEIERFAERYDHDRVIANLRSLVRCKNDKSKFDQNEISLTRRG
jgi:hypothetical protein